MATSTAKTSEQALQTAVLYFKTYSIRFNNAILLCVCGTAEPGDQMRETQEPARFTIVLQHPGALRKMFLPPNDLTLGEAYIYNDFDIEGDIEAVFQLAEQFTGSRWGKLEQARFGKRLLSLPNTGQARRPADASAKMRGTRHSKSEIGRLWPIITTDRMNFMRCGWAHEWSTLAHIS